MRKLFLSAGCFTVLAGVLSPAAVFAQSGQPYPNKLIRIVSSPPGSNIDLIARVIAHGLGTNIGQSVVIENRPDLVAIETTVKANPDGYTLLFLGSAPWMKPLMQKVTFNTLRDLTPITQTTSAPLFLYTSPSLPAKSARDLIALAKAKPGELNYGMPGAGTSAHLAAELLKNMAGVDIVRIAYKGSAQVIANVMANQVHIAFASSAGGMPHVAAGKLRVLGVANAKPSALAPDIPTIASSGLPGFEVASSQLLWAPAGTPRAAIAKLYDATARVLNNPEVKKKFLFDDIETVATTPDQTLAYVKTEISRWSKVVREANLTSD